MHPLLAQVRGLAAYLLTWLLAGTVLAVVWAQREQRESIQVLVFLLPLVFLIGMAALSTYFVCRAFPLRPARWMKALFRRAAAAGLLAVVISGAAALWNATGSLWYADSLVSLTPGAWLTMVGVQVVVYALAALMHDALLAQQAVQSAADQEATARLLAREMEIKALRRQVDPHFLFNSLNSISALIAIDPAGARAMTVDLAQFFRQTLRLGERERVRLDEELELVSTFVAIEQRRMGDKLRLRVDVDADGRSARLPPLFLQPLVENAIKHGIRPLDQGGEIIVEARRAGDRLRLRVCNPIDAEAPRDVTGLGQGLRHLQSRLQTQYDERAYIEVESTATTFTVKVSLPWHT